jgi:acyl-CoA thioesterase
MVDLETALTLHEEPGGWSAQVPDGWGQGRTTYGGLVAGYLVRAAQAADDRSVRSVDVYFIEPVSPGEVHLRVDSRRAGKNMTHLGVTLEKDGKPSAIGRFLLADPGEGPFDHVPDLPEPERSFDDAVEIPRIDGLTPEFLQNMAVRYGEGDFPMSGSTRAVAGGWVRNIGPARGVAALLSHLDAWPPPVMALVSKPVSASSVRWHVHFHGDVDSCDGEQWSWLREEATWRSGPLSTVTGMLVRDGVPVAYSEQTQVMYG